MKKLLLITLTLILSLPNKSQVVFCPPGAEWNYNFGWFSTIYQEKIQYERDSIIVTDTVKVLSHTRFHMSCVFAQPLLTLIKTKGDTVFFKNDYTQNTWQILYNFSVAAGQGWQVTILRYNGPVTLSFNIDSVNYVNINNMNLKRMYYGTEYITERIGANRFLFPFYGGSTCDGEFIAGMLCYQDSSFGLKQFTSLPCDYSTQLYAGVTEEFSKSNFKIYPNPISSVFIVEMNSTKSTQLTLTDIYGKELKREAFENTNRIDVSDLKSGLYLIVLKQEGEVIFTTKIIKE